jgi:hypothetical protein
LAFTGVVTLLRNKWVVFSVKTGFCQEEEQIRQSPELRLADTDHRNGCECTKRISKVSRDLPLPLGQFLIENCKGHSRFPRLSLIRMPTASSMPGCDISKYYEDAD